MGYMKLHVFFWTDPEPATQQHDHDFGIKVPTFSKEAGNRSSRLESAAETMGVIWITVLKIYSVTIE